MQGNYLSEDEKFNLRLLIKRCGLNWGHLSKFVGESRTMVFFDFSGGKVSDYRMLCYRYLTEFLSDLCARGITFRRYPNEKIRDAKDRRDEFVENLISEFTNKHITDL